MKPTEYIDKTMREAIARMPSTPEERDAYQKGMIARMADIEQKLKIHADNPAHVTQLKHEWNRLNGLFLASFDRSEPKQENETNEVKGDDYAVFEWTAEYGNGKTARNPSYSYANINDEDALKSFMLNHPGAKRVSGPMKAWECQKYIDDTYRDPVRYM